jgi:hypothetical protein
MGKWLLRQLIDGGENSDDLLLRQFAKILPG